MRIHYLFGLLILAGTTMLSACGKTSPQAEARQDPVVVNTITAAYQDVPDVIEVPGSVQARNRITLSAQINGFVSEVRVSSGEMVRSGQTLVTLDSREPESRKAAALAGVEEAKAALEEARKSAEVAKNMREAARASADLAQATYQRYQTLFEKRSVSPQELDEVRTRRDATAADLAAKETMVAAAQDRLRQIEARISQANAQASQAEVVLSYAVITAPAAGRVVARQVDPGSAIFPGSPLMIIETTANPQVVADMPSNQSGVLRNGLEVEIRDPLVSGAVKGKVAEITPLSDPGTHTVGFKVDLPAGYSAPAGRFVRVVVPSGQRKAMLMPRPAVRETGQLTGVFVVDGTSTARFRLVKTAPFDEQRLEILSGVDPGDKIVANSAGAIIDGTPLEVQR